MNELITYLLKNLSPIHEDDLKNILYAVLYDVEDEIKAMTLNTDLKYIDGFWTETDNTQELDRHKSIIISNSILAYLMTILQDDFTKGDEDGYITKTAIEFIYLIQKECPIIVNGMKLTQRTDLFIQKKAKQPEIFDTEKFKRFYEKNNREENEVKNVKMILGLQLAPKTYFGEAQTILYVRNAIDTGIIPFSNGWRDVDVSKFTEVKALPPITHYRDGEDYCNSSISVIRNRKELIEQVDKTLKEEIEQMEL